jgi:hypothetical protein
MKTIAFAAAVVAATVAVSAASTPAFAQAEGRFGTAKVTYQENTGRYCIRNRDAGQLVQKTSCKSKAQWAELGLTIKHKPAVVLAQR